MDRPNTQYGHMDLYCKSTPPQPLCRKTVHGKLIATLMAILSIAATHCASAQNSKATLLKPTAFTVSINGKTMGTLQLPQGTAVTILSTNGDKVLVAQSAQPDAPKAWVNKADIAGTAENPTRTPAQAPPKADSTTTPTPAPTATPSPTAEPTPAPKDRPAQASTGSTESQETWLMKSALWDNAGEIERFLVYSKTGNEVVYRKTFTEQLFGWKPREVLIHTNKDSSGNTVIQSMDVTYLELGSMLVPYMTTSATKENGKQGEPTLIETPQQKNARELEFSKIFRDAEREIQAALQTKFGQGNLVSMGNAQDLRGLIREYNADPFLLRLTIEHGHLVQLNILRKSAASRSLVSQSKTTTKAEDALANVKNLPNGDCLIENIPMISQGDRGYGAVATLAMVANYYQINVNIDALAAKAGYNSSNIVGGNLDSVCQGVAREGKLRLISAPNLVRAVAVININRGVPMIVWRNFSREREATLRQYAASYSKDSSFELPSIVQDRKNWAPHTEYFSASLITGYNKERGEYIITQPSGEGSRNRRIRFEELEACSFRVLTFAP